MARKTGKQLRERLGIINPWDYVTVAQKMGVEMAVMVDFTSEQRGRGYRSAKWQVIRPGYKTDPETHWTNNGNKTFLVFDKSAKEPERLAAIAWATERYGFDPGEPWVKAVTEARATFWVPQTVYVAVQAAYEAGEPKVRET